jgi:hypothetical protein
MKLSIILFLLISFSNTKYRKVSIPYIIKIFNIKKLKKLSSTLKLNVFKINDIENKNKFRIIYKKYINFSSTKNIINKYKIIGNSINIIIVIKLSK